MREGDRTAEDSRPRATLSGQTVSHYRILHRLGGGSMGQVFAAEDLRLGRKVALKFLHPGIAADRRMRARFEREARAAAALDHPNICTIHDIEETADGRLFIAMALCDGETLDRRIARGPLPIGEAIDIACAVARGLAKAHEAGIVHRDVKPANIALPAGARTAGAGPAAAGVKILDFGLAQLADRARLTEPGGISGTATYMSPEQARGERVDPRTDIWSLGVVLYEMLTGEPPFCGDQALAVIFSILNEDSPPASSLRPEIAADLERIVSRALAKSPRQRYGRMSDMLRALSSLGGPEDSTAVAPLPPIGPEGGPPVVTEAEPPPEAAAAPPVFVGRELELGQLERFLDPALAGRGLVAFARGEAGTGKTALLTRFAHRAQQDHPELVMAGGTCNAHTSIGDPYLPFCEVLGQLTSDIEARWAARTMTRQRASGLWRLLPHSLEAVLSDGRGLIDTFVPGAALVARARARPDLSAAAVEQLSRLVAAREAAGAEAAPTQRDLFEQYTRVLQALARHSPLLLLLDDLQWADSGSISLLFHLGKRLAGSRILILGAYRPTEVALGRGDERHPLKPVLNELRRDSGIAEVDLDRSEGRRFVDALLDTEPNRLDAAFRRTLHRQTGGHALYTVELVREMEDREALVRDQQGRWIAGPALDWKRIPARVEAVIGERIGRLPQDLRELLTLAGVEGQDFTAEVVARALGLDELGCVRRLSRELDQRHRLVEPRGIERIAGQRLSRYRFRHHLFQKYLYGRLAEPERAYLHEQVGTVLEAMYGQRAAEISTRLARHFEQAGRAEKAVRYLQQAGEKAARQSANLEAISHYEKALELLGYQPEAGGPDFPSRARRELSLLTGLGPVLMGVKGWAAPETERTYARARDLCRQVGHDLQLFPVLWGLWQASILRTELEGSREMARELLRLAESLQDPALYPVAYRALGESSFWLGELREARAFLDRGFDLYDAERHRAHGFLYGTDPGAFCLGFGGWSLWYLGYPDQAVERIERSVSLAQDIGYRFNLGLTHNFVTIVRHLRGEGSAARESAELIMALAREQGFEVLLAIGQIMHGGAMAEFGRAEDGLAELRRGLERYPSSLTRPWFMAMQAGGLRRTGDVEGALEAVARGLAVAERTGNRVWDADLHRLRGELLADRGAAAGEVGASLREAIELARRQGARSLELRAATSLARWLQSRRREREGRRILEEVYSWFSEGFETRDLRQAKELLDSLG